MISNFSPLNLKVFFSFSLCDILMYNLFYYCFTKMALSDRSSGTHFCLLHDKVMIGHQYCLTSTELWSRIREWMLACWIQFLNRFQFLPNRPFSFIWYIHLFVINNIDSECSYPEENSKTSVGCLSKGYDLLHCRIQVHIYLFLLIL